MNEASFRELISGTRRDLPSVCGRVCLDALSRFYGCGVLTRNWAFDRGWLKTHRCSIPVVSIGNLTTGGTGKTPLAAYLAHWFGSQDIRVAFLSRGYKAPAGQLNDEALVLKQLCPHVPHVQNPDRVAAARIVTAELETQLIILDDGFQHRRLTRDLDIVVVDALNPWGYGYLLPRGLLREPISSLRRADVVMLTRADQCASDARQEIKERVGQHCDASLIEIAFPPTRLVNARGETASLDSLTDKPIAVFCGIGHPTAFRQSVAEQRMIIRTFREYADHHRYSRRDIDDLDHWIRSSDVQAALVTAKDLVKIDLDQLGGVPLWAVEIGVEILRGEQMLERSLRRVAEMIQQT